MDKIPTAVEFMENHELSWQDVEYLLKAFAKLHVKAALEAASESKEKGDTFNCITKDSIINSYPLENIK